MSRTPKKVAIVGSGPAGRSAARALATAGIKVTIFEKEPEPGGLMRYGYPAFRMPDTVTQRDAENLRKLGVELKFQQTLGENLDLADLEREFDATLLAIGSAIPRHLAVPGEDLPAVYDAISFLRAARTDRPMSVGFKVLVVGGGDTSIDAATTAQDLGATAVKIIYRGSADALPALPHEVKFARARGIRYRFNSRVTELAGQGDQLAVTIKASGGTLTESWDNVIVAIGQERNTGFLQQLGVHTNPDGSTDHPSIFLAGDAAYGSNRLAKAILDGRRAAQTILTALK